uniref:Uncharacterized protein n=1 Tax=Auxenochlorella protothecoides TaxID=3075 RepID=A0A1D1ZW66_AUXPR
MSSAAGCMHAAACPAWSSICLAALVAPGITSSIGIIGSPSEETPQTLPRPCPVHPPRPCLSARALLPPLQAARPAAPPRPGRGPAPPAGGCLALHPHDAGHGHLRVRHACHRRLRGSCRGGARDPEDALGHRHPGLFIAGHCHPDPGGKLPGQGRQEDRVRHRSARAAPGGRHRRPAGGGPAGGQAGAAHRFHQRPGRPGPGHDGAPPGGPGHAAGRGDRGVRWHAAGRAGDLLAVQDHGGDLGGGGPGPDRCAKVRLGHPGRLGRAQGPHPGAAGGGGLEAGLPGQPPAEQACPCHGRLTVSVPRSSVW